MAESSGGPKKLLWVMIILVLLSSAGAAAAIYMVMDQRDDNPGEGAEETAERQPPIFLTIEPFTVNLADDRQGTRLLYAGITLRVEDEATRDLLEQHMPQLRSRLLTILSGQEAGSLTSSQGKQQLASNIKARLSEPFDEDRPPLRLSEVLFTEFIVQ